MISKVCLLDEQHEKDLCPDDSESFDYFLFGGILGNVDEMDADRTKILRMKVILVENLVRNR